MYHEPLYQEYIRLPLAMYFIYQNRLMLEACFVVLSMNDSVVDMGNVFSQTIQTHKFTRKNRTEKMCYN